MDIIKLKTAVRKALMAADARYYSWTPEQQEGFRATMSEDAGNRADTVLLKELLGISCTAKNAGQVWKDLPISKLDKLNCAKLLTRGIGADMIFLNESMDENTSLLDFNTLYDYDFNDHLFQEQANNRDFKDYQARDYYALRFSRWARLIINDCFHYATLYSLAGYVIDQAEDKGSDIIRILIPHEFVEGKNHGKTEKSGVVWDMQIDADGQEKQLDELKSRWHQYTQQRWVELSQALLHTDPAVYMVDIDQHGEQHRNFIFNNETALKQIRWRHFLADCEQIKADFANVTDMEKQELVQAESWLRGMHKNIIENFNPDVIRLRKIRKVVVAPGAFDVLMNVDNVEPE